MDASSPIGVFDSGVGGISVLRTLRRLMPGESYVYYGDTGNAPYGTKPPARILNLSRNAAAFLLARDVKAIVIACNTATAAAAQTLRAELSLPIVGMEPALKLAYDTVGPHRRVIVMATPATLESEKYHRLYALYGQNALSLPCPGLMEFAERLEVDSPALHGYLSALLTPALTRDAAAVVLGCTHYPFLRRAIAAHLPQDTLILDGNEGAARQLRRRLMDANMLKIAPDVGSVSLFSSGGEKCLKIMSNLLQESLEIS